MPWLGKSPPQFLQAFEVQIQGLAGVGKRLRQRVAAGDDIRQVWEIDGVDGFLRLIFNAENEPAIAIRRGHHWPSASSSLRMCRKDTRISV
jgi:hypothetical protein